MQGHDGYVLIYRSLLTDDILRNGDEKWAWITLIMRAAWEPSHHRVGQKLIPAARGEFVTSYNQLSKLLGWNRSRVRRFIDRLQEHKYITKVVEINGTLVTSITIRDYERFQTTKIKSEPLRHGNETVSDTASEPVPETDDETAIRHTQKDRKPAAALDLDPVGAGGLNPCHETAPPRVLETANETPDARKPTHNIEDIKKDSTSKTLDSLPSGQESRVLDVGPLGQAAERTPPQKLTENQITKIAVLRRMVAVWNAVAAPAGCTAAQPSTGTQRVRSANARWIECGRIDGQWRAVCERIAASRYLTGGVPARPQSSKPFRAYFDWVIKSENFTKITEGVYDDDPSPDSGGGIDIEAIRSQHLKSESDGGDE